MRMTRRSNVRPRAWALARRHVARLVGTATLRQYLEARLIDELDVAIAPILLGTGEHLFAGIDLPALGYACTEHVATPAATHVVFTRKA
jgi:dihydrofolate reductase